MDTQLAKINSLLETLDAAASEALDEISVHRTYAKGEYLLKAGSVCTKSFWIEQGMLRKFFMHKDKEVTTAFYFKDDIAISFYSYTLQTPGTEYIQAMTETTVKETSYQQFGEGKRQHPALLQLDLLLTEYYALSLEEKNFELQTQNATQRYQTLLRKSPHIVLQVPLTHIASYLNVSLETLSRIRSGI